jgi:hypothetical protein
LEKDSATEYLNFGTAGHFGTTQYYLMYKSLAKQFSHSGVIVGILPANDFFENDYEIGKKIHSHRYRPYLVGDYPNYKLIYYNQDELDQKGSLLAQSLRFIGGVLRGYTYSYNAITRLIDTQIVRRSLPDNKSYSGFYDFTKDQYQLMQYTLENIIEEAKGKDVTLVTIPLLTDLKRYDQFGESPLSQKLKAFSEKAGVHYIDLLPLMHDYSPDWGQYFLSCENHWGDYGNLVAFKILKSKLPIYTKAKADSKEITSK